MATEPTRTRLHPDDHAALMAAAKVRAAALRDEALDALWSSLCRAVTRFARGAWRVVHPDRAQAEAVLSRRSSTRPNQAERTTGMAPRAVQNRPRGILRLLDP